MQPVSYLLSSSFEPFLHLAEVGKSPDENWKMTHCAAAFYANVGRHALSCGTRGVRSRAELVVPVPGEGVRCSLPAGRRGTGDGVTSRAACGASCRRSCDTPRCRRPPNVRATRPLRMESCPPAYRRVAERSHTGAKALLATV